MQYAVCSHGNQTVLGEAYAYGDVDIEGDVEALFPLTTFLHRPNLSPVPQIRLGTLGDAEKSHTTHGADGSEASGSSIPGSATAGGHLSLQHVSNDFLDCFSTNALCTRVLISKLPILAWIARRNGGM